MLQKELVQVQTLMDSMTREREDESECLKKHYDQLQANYTTSEVKTPEVLEVTCSSADFHFNFFVSFCALIPTVDIIIEKICHIVKLSLCVPFSISPVVC